MWNRFQTARSSAQHWAGDQQGSLQFADWRFLLSGLDVQTAQTLSKRWGPFWSEGPGDGSPTLELVLLRDEQAGWLDPPEAGELYRIELHGQAEERLVVSYHFALARMRAETLGARHGDGLGPALPTAQSGTDAQHPPAVPPQASSLDGGSRESATWHAVISQGAQEPAERIIENLLRYLVSRQAIECGGVPLHSAAVLDGDRAQVFVGPSRSGKSTAVRLSGAPSLGDDFGMILPDGEGWKTCAFPFDNSEQVLTRAVPGWIPVEGVWRLFQSETPSVDYPAAMLASVSLMTGVAFPWAFRDLSDQLLASVDRLAGSGRYGHLHFAKDSTFWELIRVSGD